MPSTPPLTAVPCQQHLIENRSSTEYGADRRELLWKRIEGAIEELKHTDYQPDATRH